LSNTYIVTLRDSASNRYVYEADYFAYSDYYGVPGKGVTFFRVSTDPNAPVKALPIAYFKHVTEVQLDSRIEAQKFNATLAANAQRG
jgi:hypothetical protein